MAAARCKSALAYGIGDAVLPRIPDGRSYGQVLDRTFVSDYFQDLHEFREAVLKAAGHDVKEHTGSNKGSPAALYRQPLLRLWAGLLHEVCRHTVYDEWVLTHHKLLGSLIPMPPDTSTRPSSLVLTATPVEALTRLSATHKIPVVAGWAPTRRVKACCPAIDRLLEHIKEAHSFSGWYRDLVQQDKAPRDTFMDSFRAALGRPTEDKLFNVLRAFARWKRWVANESPDDSICVYKPRAVEMADFLASASRGGATAAAQLYATLKMAASMMLLDLSLDEKLCKGWATTLPHHKTKQQLLLDLNEIAHFEKVVRDHGPVVAVACAEILLCLWGMVRPKHIQKSRLLQSTEHFWVFECVQGKRRVGSYQPPFLWTLPRATLLGDDIMPKIVENLREAGAEEEPWLLRQWSPSHSDPFNADQFIEKPLLPYQARAARKTIMQRPPLQLTEAAATETAAYRSRHVCPTIASGMRFDEREGAALSNWRGMKDKGQQEMANCMQMLYDQSKVPQQCSAKWMCVQGIRESARKLKDYNLPWGHYNAAMPDASKYREEAKRLSQDILPPEGRSAAALSGARVPFTPAEAVQTEEKKPVPRSPSPAEESEGSASDSDSSSVEPRRKSQGSLQEAMNVAIATNMLYSLKQRTGVVHMMSEAESTSYGYKATCGVLIKSSNAQTCNAWEANRDRGLLGWCQRCKKSWPAQLDTILQD